MMRKRTFAHFLFFESRLTFHDCRSRSLSDSPLFAQANSLAPIRRSREDDVRARLSVRRGFGDAPGARARRSVTRADAGRRTRRTVTSPMSLAASVRVSPASSIRANRASLARSSSPLDDGIRLTERSTAFIIRLRHAQAAAARVAPRNGLSSRRRVATGTVALRAQPRSRTVARSAPYTPLKINAVRHLSRNLKLRSLCRSTPRSRTTACRFFSTTTTTTTTRRLHRAEAARSRARNARVETRDDSSNDSSLARTDVDRRRRTRVSSASVVKRR